MMQSLFLFVSQFIERFVEYFRNFFFTKSNHSTQIFFFLIWFRFPTLKRTLGWFWNFEVQVAMLAIAYFNKIFLRKKFDRESFLNQLFCLTMF